MSVWIVVGLGNPDPEHRANRHNVGFMVADEILRRTRAPAPRPKHGASLAETQLGGERAIVCKPMEYMNVSGQAVARVARFWKVPAERVLVVHDDLDLPFGRLRLAPGGGPGGHNGLKSIIAELGTPDFPRVRIGIDRPPPGRDPAGYVLSDFSAPERAALPEIVARAADAAEQVLGAGVARAMNKFNARPKPVARAATEITAPTETAPKPTPHTKSPTTKPTKPTAE